MSITLNNLIKFDNRENVLNNKTFSIWLYNWMMFLINLYNRVKKELRIDFDSFIIIQLVVSNHLYKSNKNCNKSYQNIEKEMKVSKFIKWIKKKLNYVSISEVFGLLRETIRRKVVNLNKRDILSYNRERINLGTEYKTIYKSFISQTTLEMILLLKKMQLDGSLKKLLYLNKNYFSKK